MSDEQTNGEWISADFEPGLVSLIVPTYNRSALLSDTIHSVFAQTRRPLEIVVGDDASTDDTREMLESLKDDCPDGVRMQVFGDSKVGPDVLRNQGADLSRGEFVMFLDSDDLLTPNALHQHVVNLDASGADVSWAPWRELFIESDHCRLDRPIVRNFSKDWLADLIRGEWLSPSALLYRRKALTRVAGWYPPALLDDDFDFNVQIGLSGATLVGGADVVSYYRRGHSDQLTRRDFGKKTEATQLVLQRAEQAMDRQDSWTPARREALAARYFQTARMLWYYTSDLEGFKQLAAEAKRVHPQFKPPKTWYRLIASVAGLHNAERIGAIGRKLFR